MLKLTFITPGFQGQTAELYEGVTKVGRAQENSLILCDNSVSAHHCEIIVDADGVSIRDLGSANGCFVNGSRITGVMPVGDGDTLKFGSIAARLQQISGEEVFSTEWTAVHHHADSAKKEVKAPRAGEGFPTIIAPANEFLSTDHTIISPKPQSDAPAGGSQITHSAPTREKQQGSLAVLVTVALAVLLFVIWWFVR